MSVSREEAERTLRKIHNIPDGMSVDEFLTQRDLVGRKVKPGTSPNVPGMLVRSANKPAERKASDEKIT